MKKTFAMSMTLAVFMSAAAGWAQAQPAAPVHSLRSGEVSAEDQVFEAKAYQGKRPGAQKVIARTFTGQPPLIPHAVDNFDDINLEENQCLSCHGPENFKKKQAPKIGVSHFNNPRSGEVMKAVSNARHNCTTCHVPQVDAPPLVENAFKGVVAKASLKAASKAK